MRKAAGSEDVGGSTRAWCRLASFALFLTKISKLHNVSALAFTISWQPFRIALLRALTLRACSILFHGLEYTPADIRPMLTIIHDYIATRSAPKALLLPIDPTSSSPIASRRQMKQALVVYALKKWTKGDEEI
jgi:hypothetical protein